MQLNHPLLCQGTAVQHPLLRIVGAGADTFTVAQLPARVNAGVAVGFLFNQSDMPASHVIQLRFINEVGNDARVQGAVINCWSNGTGWHGHCRTYTFPPIASFAPI